jgi:hypothetical protein
MRSTDRLLNRLEESGIGIVMSRIVRRLLLTSLIAYHAAVSLCGPCLHELQGSSHEMGVASKSRPSESPAGSRGESTDLCPICHFVAQGQLPVEFWYVSLVQAIAELTVTAVPLSQPPSIPSPSNPRAPPQIPLELS